jgi:hypothetical protein
MPFNNNEDSLFSLSRTCSPSSMLFFPLKNPKYSIVDIPKLVQRKLMKLSKLKDKCVIFLLMMACINNVERRIKEYFPIFSKLTLRWTWFLISSLKTFPKETFFKRFLLLVINFFLLSKHFLLFFGSRCLNYPSNIVSNHSYN